MGWVGVRNCARKVTSSYAIVVYVLEGMICSNSNAFNDRLLYILHGLITESSIKWSREESFEVFLIEHA